MSHEPPTIGVVVLTLDEEKNLDRCLSSVRRWAREILVVDSGSSDGTLEIAEANGARVFAHPFETHAKQWNWALAKVSDDIEWVLALDADHAVSDALAQEMTAALVAAPADVEGYYVRRRQIFRGRWIRHGGYYPKYLLKLFRRGCARTDEGELADHRFYVNGKTEKLEHDIVERNHNEDDITRWSEKHLVYVERQAREEYLRRRGRLQWPVEPRFWGTPDQRVFWMKRIWYRLPLYVRPVAYFGYRYFLRLGFLDGKEGLVFHLLQSFWYRLLVDIKLEELERAQEAPRQGPVSDTAAKDA